MILKWWGPSFTEEQINIAAFGNNNNNEASLNTCKSTIKKLTDPNGIESTVSGLWPLKGTIVSNITFNKPILVNTILMTGGRHAVLIVGYENNGQTVIFNDPSYTNPKQFEKLPFDDFCIGINFQVDSYLEITSPYIPIGIFDGVTIPSGPRQLTYPVSASTYTSNFVRKQGSQAVVTEWQWTLSFYHSGGTYTVPTGPNNDGPLISTCNVPAFSLPSGYEWSYDVDGIVKGDIYVWVMDSDGYPHENETYVGYKPQNSYPAYVWYFDKTVSTVQPDVKAHHKVALQNDQFLFGADITFMAGNTIDIYNGITINNGSVVNFVVDPAFRYPPADECEGVQEWDPNQHWTEYSVEDLRTNDDRLWECINVGFSYYEPSGPYGHYGWSEIGPCN